MVSKWTLAVLTILLLIGGYLRLHNLAGRATYEWDQARDHTAVSLMLEQLKPVLVGPVIQGQGGFMLGSLYYYLLVPAHLLTSGNPLSQPITSVIIDLVLIILLFVAGLRFFRPETGLILAGLWAFLNYPINLSLVSWNVSLVPLYTLGSLVLGLQLASRYRLRTFFFACFWFGLSWHVHPSVIFQIPLIFWISRALFPRFTWSTIALALGSLLIPLIPWLIFDLRHSFTNLKLLFAFFAFPSLPTSLTLTISSIWQKYAFELSQIIFGRQLLFAGSALILVQLIYLSLAHHFLARFLKINLLASFLALVFMRNPDFGNYYLLPLLLLNVAFLAHLLTSLPRPLRVLLLGLLLSFQLTQYRFATQPYSLSIKAEILEVIATWKNPVDLEISLPVGRRSGFDWYLAHQSSLVASDSALDVAYIVESDELEITAPEKARSIVIEKTLGGFRFVGYAHNP